MNQVQPSATPQAAGQWKPKSLSFAAITARTQPLTWRARGVCSTRPTARDSRACTGKIALNTFWRRSKRELMVCWCWLFGRWLHFLEGNLRARRRTTICATCSMKSAWAASGCAW